MTMTTATQAPTMREIIREKLRGQSASRVAAQSGLDRMQVTRFARGERDLTLASAEKLVRALGLELTTASNP